MPPLRLGVGLPFGSAASLANGQVRADAAGDEEPAIVTIHSPPVSGNGSQPSSPFKDKDTVLYLLHFLELADVLSLAHASRNERAFVLRIPVFARAEATARLSTQRREEMARLIASPAEPQCLFYANWANGVVLVTAGLGSFFGTIMLAGLHVRVGTQDPAADGQLIVGVSLPVMALSAGLGWLGCTRSARRERQRVRARFHLDTARDAHSRATRELRESWTRPPGPDGQDEKQGQQDDLSRRH